MLFNFFKKDYKHYQERGDRLFEEDRFAEARHDYEQALTLLKADTPAEVSAYLADRITASGNQLAVLNMREAVHAFQSGNAAKAIEHAELALEQAKDAAIRQNAKDFIQQVEHPESRPAAKVHGHSCSSCDGSHQAAAVTPETSTEFLPLMERYHLLIQPLPGDLPERYREMGEKFAYAYIAVHDERVEEGYRTFTELSREMKSDIVEYEIAIIDFQAQNLVACENRLKTALSINAGNPLCHLAMVQLLIATRRLPDAAAMLQQMIASGHLADQATIMLGEVLLMMGDADAALARFIEALDLPNVSKLAAQKAIPVLEGLGRTADAQALAKRYLKGCC